MNGNMIPEEWKESFRMSQRTIYSVNSYEHTVRELSPGLIPS